MYMKWSNLKIGVFTKIEKILDWGVLPNMEADKKEVLYITNIIALASTICSFFLTSLEYFLITDKFITFNSSLFVLLSASILWLHYKQVLLYTRVYFFSLAGLLSFYYSCVADHEVLSLSLLYLAIGVNSIFAFSYRERTWTLIAIAYSILLFILDLSPLKQFFPHFHIMSVQDKTNLNYLVLGTVILNLFIVTFLIIQRKLKNEQFFLNLKEAELLESPFYDKKEKLELVKSNELLMSEIQTIQKLLEEQSTELTIKNEKIKEITYLLDTVYPNIGYQGKDIVETILPESPTYTQPQQPAWVRSITRFQTYIINKITTLLSLGVTASLDVELQEVTYTINAVALFTILIASSGGIYFFFAGIPIMFVNSFLHAFMCVPVLYFHHKGVLFKTRFIFAIANGLIIFYNTMVVDHQTVQLTIFYLAIAFNSALGFTKKERKWAIGLIIYTIFLIGIEVSPIKHYLPHLHWMPQKDIELFNVAISWEIFISLVTSTLFLNYIQKNKQNILKEAHFNAQKLRLQLEKEKTELIKNNEKLSDEIKKTQNILLLRSQELVEQSEKLTEVTNLIESLNLDTLDGNATPDISHLRLNSDEDWNFLQLHFDKQNQNFSTQFLKKYPNLTHNDVRLAILMKLNLGTKEIAQLLGVSIAAIQKSRYRLKKKLSLNEEEDLSAFLHSFNV